MKAVLTTIILTALFTTTANAACKTELENMRTAQKYSDLVQAQVQAPQAYKTNTKTVLRDLQAIYGACMNKELDETPIKVLDTNTAQ